MSYGLSTYFQSTRRWPLWRETRRCERDLVITHERLATPKRAKADTSLRVAPKKWGHAVMLVADLNLANCAPRALPGPIWSSNASIKYVLTRPYAIGRG